MVYGQRPTQGPKGPLTRSNFGQSQGKFGPKGLPQGLVEIVRSNKYFYFCTFLGYMVYGQRPTQGLKGPLTRSNFGQSQGKFGPKGLPQGLVEIVRSNN